MKWKPEEDTILHLVPLSGKGPVRSFQAPKYFTFHYMNAFESGAACSTAVRLGLFWNNELSAWRSQLHAVSAACYLCCMLSR